MWQYLLYELLTTAGWGRYASVFFNYFSHPGGTIRPWFAYTVTQCFIITQCGNCRIFLSLMFYVKSKSAVLTNCEVLNFDFMTFCTFWKMKLTKLTKFRAPKMAKIAVLGPLDSPNLISRKIWVTENSEISTLGPAKYL